MMTTRAREKDPIDQMVGQQLRLLREFKKMSQMTLGEKLGVSRIKIGQFESGQSSIPSSMLFKIAQVFGVDVSTFFQFVDMPDEGENHSNPLDLLADREFIEMLKDYGALNDKNVRQCLRAVLERVAELSQD